MPIGNHRWQDKMTGRFLDVRMLEYTSGWVMTLLGTREPAQPGILIMAHALFPVCPWPCRVSNVTTNQCQVQTRCQAAGKRLLFEGSAQASDRRSADQPRCWNNSCSWWLMPNLEPANHDSSRLSFSKKNTRGAFRSHERMPRGREMSSSLPHPGRSEILGIGRLAVRGAQGKPTTRPNCSGVLYDR
jgi:hypothetical protein